eukprot:1158206-Pelagomonas_calceolata.AAC.3
MHTGTNLPMNKWVNKRANNVPNPAQPGCHLTQLLGKHSAVYMATCSVHIHVRTRAACKKQDTACTCTSLQEGRAAELQELLGNPADFRLRSPGAVRLTWPWGSHTSLGLAYELYFPLPALPLQAVQAVCWHWGSRTPLGPAHEQQPPLACLALTNSMAALPPLMVHSCCGVMFAVPCSALLVYFLPHARTHILLVDG